MVCCGFDELSNIPNFISFILIDVTVLLVAIVSCDAADASKDFDIQIIAIPIKGIGENVL